SSTSSRYAPTTSWRSTRSSGTCRQKSASSSSTSRPCGPSPDTGCERKPKRPNAQASFPHERRRGVERVDRPPMAGDIDAPRHQHAVVALHMVEKARRCVHAPSSRKCIPAFQFAHPSAPLLQVTRLKRGTWTPRLSAIGPGGERSGFFLKSRHSRNKVDCVL